VIGERAAVRGALASSREFVARDAISAWDAARAIVAAGAS
jgi:hypothetical protein